MVRALSSQDWYKSKGAHDLKATHSGDGTVEVRYMESQIYIMVTALAADETVTINTPFDFQILDCNILAVVGVTDRVIALKNGSDTIESLTIATTSTMYKADSLAAYLEFNKGDNDLILAASGGSGDAEFVVTLPVIDLSKL